MHKYSLYDTEPYQIFHEVLETLEKEKALRDVIIIGSWALYLYQYQYHKDFEIGITTDMDIVIPYEDRPKEKINLIQIFKPLGLEYESNTMRMSSRFRNVESDFTLDLLTFPDKDGHKNHFGVDAVPLDGLAMLRHTTFINYEGFQVQVPEVEAYFLQKLLIRSKRKEWNMLKAAKDEAACKAVAPFLDPEKVRQYMRSLGPKAVEKIHTALEEMGITNVIDMINGPK